MTTIFENVHVRSKPELHHIKCLLLPCEVVDDTSKRFNRLTFVWLGVFGTSVLTFVLKFSIK